MKRKVNLVGTNTLTVSLPTKWAEQNNIRKGSELECEEFGSSISFAAKPHIAAPATTTIDLKGQQWYQISHTVKIAYQSGVQQIILTHPNITMLDDVHRNSIPVSRALRKLCDRFIGLEITSQTTDKTEFTSFAMIGDNGLLQTERRILHLLTELSIEFQEALKKTPCTFADTASERHDNITKYVHYYLRELHSAPISPIERQTAYAAVMQIDQAIDAVRHCAEKVTKQGTTPKANALIKEILQNEIAMFESFLKGKPNSLLVQQRYSIRKQYTSSSWNAKELQVVSEISALLNSSYLLFEAAVARQFVTNQLLR